MAATTSLRRVIGGPARRVRRVVQRAFVPDLRETVDELVADRDRLFRELAVAFESVTAAHRGIADIQEEQRALRERLDMTLMFAESLVPRIEELDDGLLEARRLSLRIAELADVVTEVVLPLHDRDIDPSRFEKLPADTL
jgi:predicted nuclease with TOPRIM domain